VIQHVIRGGHVDVEDDWDGTGGKALVISHPSGDQTVLLLDEDGAMWVGKKLKGEQTVEAFQSMPVVETA
jgi:hypothetical protein